ncbi:MAG: tetraacyldisaccharide 4'-kinase [Candidatus Sumerlaeia bacterium]|nr:tetraacyldisaccharide 4'-kinase [Candidatus Sumerlaeia bacterium]
MGLREQFLRLADDGRPHSPAELALQRVLAPLGLAYGAGAAANRLLYDTGIRERHRAPVPVVSVGNLTLGGTGKTPFCVWLTRWMQSTGKRPAILTRGYGREDESQLTIVHDGKYLKATTRTAGDEPVLLARLLGDTPIVACADRSRAARLAVKRLAVDSLVLDDGFQHLAMARDCDIVLLDATRPLEELQLFPRGTLREPLGALRNAHLVVATRMHQAGDEARRLLRWLKREHPGLPLVRTDVGLVSGRLFHETAEITAEELRGRKVVLACGLANPRSFRQTLEGAGMRVMAARYLADHEGLTAKELRKLDASRKRLGADFIAITEKDAVKLDDPNRVPESVLVAAARIDFLAPEDEARAQRTIAARLATRPVRGLLAGGKRG